MSRRNRILLIDDDAAIASGLEQILDPEGIDLHWHSSLITLPMKIKQIDPDLILLDLNLPALSGVALLEAGVKRVLRTDAPIVIFSGLPPVELSQLARHHGVAGFLSKGDDVNQTIADIRIFLHNAKIRKGTHHAAAAAAPTSA
jgi:DNA-binding response OmpR family regulator